MEEEAWKTLLEMVLQSQNWLLYLQDPMQNEKAPLSGVPVMAQQKQIQLGTMRLWV